MWEVGEAGMNGELELRLGIKLLLVLHWKNPRTLRSLLYCAPSTLRSPWGVNPFDLATAFTPLHGYVTGCRLHRNVLTLG